MLFTANERFLKADRGVMQRFLKAVDGNCYTTIASSSAATAANKAQKPKN